MERKFKVSLTEDELKAVILYNVNKMTQIHYHTSGENTTDFNEMTTERSSRIHDLTKRLNKTDVDTSDAPKEEGWT